MKNNTAIDKFVDNLVADNPPPEPPLESADMRQYALCDSARIVSLIPLATLDYIRTYADPQNREKCFSILDNLGIDLICHMIAEGALLIQISKTLHVPYLILYEWVERDTNFILKFEAAKKAAADVYSYLALKTLQDCGPIPAAVSLAKQIAAHYTWMAKTYKPETYTTDTQKAAGGDEGAVFNINF